MLEIKNLSFQYGQKQILKNFQHTFVEGKIYGLAGLSGVGKSTLCKILCGQLKPQAGEVRLRDELINGQMSKKIIMVSQEFDLFAWQTVGQTIDFFKAPGLSKSDLLKFVSLQSHEQQYPKQLSGGMKKRLSLCRALSGDPSVLIIDELFSSQDADLQMDLFHKLTDYVREKKKILIIVSHDTHFLKENCDEFLNL
jgi:ABC-type multidrug transport system ATPase subunit